MGQQPPALNCKVNQNHQNHQVTHTKEFFLRNKKPIVNKDQSDTNNTNLPSESAIPPTSPRSELTRNTSEKNFSAKISRQTTKIRTFIPEHEAITRVSETAFKGSVKNKKLHVEQKVKSLAEIVESRYNTAKHFPYSQILGLTQNLVYGLSYMSKKKCNHHDFYPTNVYYSDGKFKIINPLELPCSGFHLTCQKETSQADLGDECMSKSDVFAIGMILLEVCTLQPSSECFDEESYNIVDERLAKVAKVYTPVMAECINIMLQYEAEARIDPINLAQLVHWKIQNQKLIAMQMEAPKQPPHAQGKQPMPPGAQGPPGGRMMSPQNMPPQQMRGPPPPPYMHQPFMMQNLNQNVIAVSLPNEQFARIGPNNQGFLSSSSLQQKLRVIELIKQHPKEDDEEQMHNSRSDEATQNQVEKDRKEIKEPVKAEIMNVFVEKQDPKPQYPFVESIYSEKPLAEVNFEAQRKAQHQIVRRNVPESKPNVVPQSDLSKVPLVREPPQVLSYQVNQNLNPYQGQGQEFTQPRIQNYVRQEARAPLVQGYEDRIIQQQKVEEIKPRSPVNVYNEASKQAIYNETTKQTFLNEVPKQIIYNEVPKHTVYTEGPKQGYVFQAQKYMKGNNEAGQFSGTGERVQVKVEQKGQYLVSQNYGTAISKNPPTINNNVYTMGSGSGLGSGPSSQTSFGLIETQDSQTVYAKRYGTSFQPTTNQNQNSSESIEERVQRVLNMSRNAK